MFLHRCSAAALLSCGLLWGSFAAEVKEKPVSPDEKAVAAGNNAFAAALFPKVAGAGGNTFFSPVSLSTALAMAYAGAGGDTAQEMAQALRFTLPPDRLHPAFAALTRTLADAGTPPAYQMNVANALWTQKGFPLQPAFLEIMKRDYAAGEHAVDFKASVEAARLTINQWVEEQTREKIKNLLAAGSLTPDVRLVLTNAIYFKGKWRVPFEHEATYAQDFHAAPGKTFKANMMHQVAFMPYHEDAEMKALELPYQGPLSMVLILPKKQHNLAAVEKQLSGETLEKWVVHHRQQRVQIALPKFKMDAGFELAKALASLGMAKAFSPAQADFKAMANVPGEPLFIGAVIHKAFVALDELGTEAAAATAITMRAGSAMNPEKPKEFIADQPFLFFIRDQRTGAILFLGRCAEPTKAS